MENSCSNSEEAREELSSLSDLINIVFPYHDFDKQIFHNGNYFELVVEPTCHQSCCPVCNSPSSSVHSRYTRILQHQPLMGCPVRLIIKVRKFFCHNKDCERKIFSEQFESFVAKNARLSNSVKSLIEKILLETSSLKGTYLLSQLGYDISPSTCLRTLHKIKMPDNQGVKVVGIDDYAFRKGLSYGTIIVDQESNRAIDMIDSREHDGVSKWLREHPSINIVTRDRAAGYSNAISSALPKSIQIADKFHLVKNLGDRITEEIRAAYDDIKTTFNKAELGKMSDTSADDCSATTSITTPRSPKTERSEAIFNSVLQCKSEGLSRRATAQRLGISVTTACRYWDMTHNDIFVAKYDNNYSAFIDSINDCIAKRYCMKDIFKYIVQQGFKGKLTAFYIWFNKHYPEYKQQRDNAKQPDLSAQWYKSVAIS